MASVVVTLKIMPKSPDVNLDKVYESVQRSVNGFIDERHRNGEVRKIIEPIGFGLKALKVIFVMDEAIGSTDGLEESIRNNADVESVETIDVRRAIG